MSEEKVCEEGKEKDFVKEYCKCKAIEGKEEKISRNKGYPELIVREGYVDDKVSSLKSRWDWVKRKEGGKDDVVVD